MGVSTFPKHSPGWYSDLARAFERGIDRIEVDGWLFDKAHYDIMNLTTWFLVLRIDGTRPCMKFQVPDHERMLNESGVYDRLKVAEEKQRQYLLSEASYRGQGYW